MAGGMNRARGPTLAERVGRTPSLSAGGRHCWVEDAPGHPGRYPGLLVEWRRSATGWEGRVVYALPDAGSPRLTERWVDSRHLTPLEVPS